MALAEAVGDVAGIDAGLKWPNDLVVDDRKLAGLLAEAEGDALVVGAGVQRELGRRSPPELRATATACNLEAGHPVDRDALLDAFLDRLAAAPGRASTGSSTTTGRGSPRSGARCASSTCATPISSATAVGVTDDGALVVRDDAGTDHTVVAADVAPPPLTRLTFRRRSIRAMTR